MDNLKSLHYWCCARGFELKSVPAKKDERDVLPTTPLGEPASVDAAAQGAALTSNVADEVLADQVLWKGGVDTSELSIWSPAGVVHAPMPHSAPSTYCVPVHAPRPHSAPSTYCLPSPNCDMSHSGMNGTIGSREGRSPLFALPSAGTWLRPLPVRHQGTPPSPQVTPTRPMGTPPRQQGTPPRRQGTPPRVQGTPPRHQGTPPRHSRAPDQGVPEIPTEAAPRVQPLSEGKTDARGPSGKREDLCTPDADSHKSGPVCPSSGGEANYILSTPTGAFAPRPITPKEAGGWDKADVSYIEQRTAEQRPSTPRKNIYASSSPDGSSNVASCTGFTPRASTPKKTGGWEEVDVPYIEQRFAKQPYIVSTTTGAFAPRPLTPKRAGGWDKADVSYIEQRTAEQRPSTPRKNIYASSSPDGSSNVASCTGCTPRASTPKKTGGWEEVDVSYIERTSSRS